MASRTDDPPLRPAQSRSFRLIVIALSVALVSGGFWVLGRVLDSPLIGFVGKMIAASTFVPAPADTFVLAVSSSLSPVVVGVVGGLINAIVVSVVERRWVLLVLDHPFFERFSGVFGAEVDEDALDNDTADARGWTYKTVNWAQRHMFAGLVVGGASILPFEPFRLLAITSGYPPSRYALATFISRGTRYWAIAEFGQILSGYGWLKPVIYATLTIFFIGVARSMIKFWRLAPAASDS